ncbi:MULTISPECIES: DUF4044 domain-containing protein [Clostridium]|jgi:hypothetical protein|nr:MULTISPECIES: DUF4044 domain-containing protein [Clostridium]WRY53053.1 DUF4044 domain-containing protein [Clostridium intestinale]
MKKKTREKAQYILVIFIIITFLIGLLPMVLR